jgi:hypothetical protein
MKNLLNLILLLLISAPLVAQTENQSEILLTSTYSSDNADLSDILQFENIDFYNLTFSGKMLIGKSYNLTVKEIWDGKIKMETTISNSSKISVKRFQSINSDVFKLKVISKLTSDNKLKMSFKFPNYSVTKEFEAIDSDDYSLRVIGENSKIEIGKKFYLLAYILPYEKDGGKYWCEVEDSGKNIENWGKDFGIKHYLVFEMTFN